jgi:hypothetical protein
MAAWNSIHPTPIPCQPSLSVDRRLSWSTRTTRFASPSAAQEAQFELAAFRSADRKTSCGLIGLEIAIVLPWLRRRVRR